MIENQDKSFPYMLSKLILHCKSGLRFTAILNILKETKTAKSSRFILFKIELENCTILTVKCLSRLLFVVYQMDQKRQSRLELMFKFLPSLFINTILFRLYSKIVTAIFKVFACFTLCTCAKFFFVILLVVQNITLMLHLIFLKQNIFVIAASSYLLRLKDFRRTDRPID